MLCWTTKIEGSVGSLARELYLATVFGRDFMPFCSLSRPTQQDIDKHHLLRTAVDPGIVVAVLGVSREVGGVPPDGAGDRALRQVSLLADGNLLVSGSDDKTLKIWSKGSSGTFECKSTLTGHRYVPSL